MIRKITLLFLAFLGMSSLSMAQPVCGFDEIHTKRMQADPAFANYVNQFNADVSAWIAQNANGPQSLVTTFNGNLAWEIPVVVHVIHLSGTGHNIGQTYNPSDATITNFVNYLSQAFTASYTGVPAHLQESAGGTRLPIVFKLAQRTPNNAATNGIIRMDKSSDVTYAADGVQGFTATGITENALKAFSYWPNTQYYNIWVVYKIDGENQASSSGSYIAGYAQFPTAGISATDGTVVLADQVAVGNSVITHELGHAFGLYHVFNGGTTTVCPPAPDDFVADTEPIRQSNFNCPSDPNPCTSTSYLNTQRNFMDYSNCKDRFTPGQRTRVYAALQALTGAIPSLAIPSVRSSLISSLGATPPSAMPAATCVPTGAIPLNSLGPRAVTIQKQGGVDTIIMNAISGSNQTDGAHYYDRSQEHRAELRAGGTYRFRVTVGGNFEQVIAWIDYNNNGVFETPSERLFTPVTDNNTFNFINFTVPASGPVNCVPIRMRVITNPGAGGNPCPTNYGGQCEDYQVVIRGAGGVANIPGLATIIQPPLGGNPSCFGSSVTVAATYQNTITPVWYKWYRKIATVPYTVTEIKTSIDSFVTRTDWSNLDTVWAKVAYPGLCGIDTTFTDSIVLNRPITVAPTVTISPTKGTVPGCPDDTVRFTVTNNSNPGATPTYEWFVNGISQGPASATATFFETFNIPSGTTFRVRMNSSAPAPCSNPGFALSNIITYTHINKVPTLSIALISGTNPGCPNQALTFKATGTTAGLTPTYTWFVNSVQMQTGSSNTYTSVLNNGDVVSCTMLSSTSCAVPNTATSNNTITITHTPLTADVTIQQISGNNPACTGHWMVFVATPTNSGANPQFQWMVNNAPVAGANSPIFSIKTLLNGDFVSCILISTDPCVQNTFDTSAILPMVITTSKSPKLSVAITAGNNPGCLDSLVEFTATETDLGTAPNFDWLVNGFQTYNGSVFSTSNLLNGDVVVCRANQTDNGCYLPDTLFSTPITMVRSVTPNPPIISLVNNRLVTNITGSFIWFGPKGQMTGGENGNFHPDTLGQYWAVTNNNGCWSKPSNKLTITLLDINTYNINEVSIYPNPTAGQVVLDWGGHSVTMKVGVYSTVGQKLMETAVVKQTRTTVDLGKLANGVYFIVLTDEQGRSGTARITVTK